jgi:phosphate transport system substrate-binding protein
MAFPRIATLAAVPLILGTGWAASPRFARLGNFEGSVQVQFEAADPWRPATPNLPLTESTRIRTGPDARLEIELDDTSVFRMAGEGLAELTDYTELSGGQKVTVLSLDSGLAYFTGEPSEGNSIHLLVPGAQATLRQGSRIRLQASPSSSEIAIMEGAVRFVIPTADMDLHQGQSARVTIPASDHFSLFREISPLDLDGWNEELDKAEADAPSSRLDLDRAGHWITTGDYGLVWKPPVEQGWAPFRQGRWIWFQSIGFAWAADERWGWAPYHEGRWLQHPELGWVWVQGAEDAPFSPGEVYWARGANLAVWGPLAPGEEWAGTAPPKQFAALNTTGGAFVSGNREITAGAELPKDLLKAITFTTALPSPALPVARLTATRDPLRTRQFTAVDVAPAVPHVTQADPPPETRAAAAPAPALVADAVQPAAPIDSDPPPTNPAPIVPGIVLLKTPSRAIVAPSVTPANHAFNVAGVTLAKDLVPQWLNQYHDSSVHFTDSASGQAISDLVAGSISLAINDEPVSADQLRALGKRKLVQIPIALDAVSVVYNINGFSTDLKVTPEILAAIYLGYVRRWNDPLIADANPGAYLPAQDIIPVHRSDGCAPTLVFTDYLSKISSGWKSRAGSGDTVNWPVMGLDAGSDDAVAKLVRQTPGTIGYVAQPLAGKSHLAAAWLKNRSGAMVQPTAASLTAAAAGVVAGNSGESLQSLTNASGTQAYPLVSVLWAVAPSRSLSSGPMAALLNWILSTGQRQYGSLAFAPLPAPMIAQSQLLVRGIQ